MLSDFSIKFNFINCSSYNSSFSQIILTNFSINKSKSSKTKKNPCFGLYFVPLYIQNNKKTLSYQVSWQKK